MPLCPQQLLSVLGEAGPRAGHCPVPAPQINPFPGHQPSLTPPGSLLAFFKWHPSFQGKFGKEAFSLP